MTIDISKPIEMFDGTPLVAKGKWIERIDGGRIYWGDYDYQYVSISPDEDDLGWPGNRPPFRNVADPDTVMVKRMTEEEAIDFLNTLPGTIEGRFRVGLRVLRGLGFVATPADRFKSDNPEWALRDRGDLIEDVLAWASKQ